MKNDILSKRERAELTLDLQETDRAPVYDLLFNDAIIEYFSEKRCTYGDEALRAKCKAISKTLDMTRAVYNVPIKPGDYTSEDGFVSRVNRWTNMGIVKKPFDDQAGAVEWLKRATAKLQKEADNINLKEYGKTHRENLRKIQSYIGDDTVVLIRESGTGLDVVRHLLGLELFSYIYIDEPELISEYLEVYTQLEVKTIHAVSDKKLSPCALTYGDIAMKKMLMHSPKWLREEFFPKLKRLNEAYHEHGIKCLFHSDGYLMDVMDDLIATGIDGINPIEIVAGMDLEEVKQKYGDKLFIAGGIDMSQLLSNGTPAEVREESIKAISIASPGYFIGSTTELDNSARPENILAMLETAWNKRT